MGPGDGLSVRTWILFPVLTLVGVAFGGARADAPAGPGSAPTAAVEAGTTAEGSAVPTGAAALLVAEPLGFDLGTVHRLEDAVRQLPEEAPALVMRIRDRGLALGVFRSALILSLFVAIGFVLLKPRALSRSVERRIAPRLAHAPPNARPWLAASLQVLIATAPPFVLWLAHDAVQRATGFQGGGFLLTGVALRAWLQFALTVSVWRELVVRPLLPVPVQHRAYLFRIGHGLALYVAALAFLSEVVSLAELPPDLWALIRSLSNLGLLVLLALLALRKEAVLALLPVVPNRLYQRFVSALRHAYPVAVGLTVSTALLEWAGYERLAQFVWVRTWALAGLFVGAVLVAHGLHLALRKAVLAGDAPPGDAAHRFARSACRLLDYGIFVGVLVLALDLTGASAPLGRILGVTVYRLADGPVSLLALIEALAVVLVFLFASRLVRDFLDYKVYPALGVEESISHACNVFLHYAMLIVGALFAVEFVGIGLGALTVFAGAMGIGLGFGLQPLASNLSSGLTLVFGRSLRKGDWVTVGSTIGRIEEVGMRATTLRTWDSVEYVVPNTEFVSGTIVNWTKSSPLVCEHLKVLVAQGSDPDHVQVVLREVAAAATSIEREPAPEIWLAALSPAGIEFELAVWLDLKRHAWPPVRSELYFGILAAFREHGIALPDAAPEPPPDSVRSELLAALEIPPGDPPSPRRSRVSG